MTRMLSVRVTPRASSDRVITEMQDDGSLLLRVYVTAPAVDGRANDAVIAQLSKMMRLPKRAFTIIRGDTHRDKVIAVEE